MINGTSLMMKVSTSLRYVYSILLLSTMVIHLEASNVCCFLDDVY